MAGLIDTNLLLYAANQDAAEHSAARDFLIQALESAEAWYLTDGIIYEFLRVSTHPKVFEHPLDWKESISFLEPLIDSNGVHWLRPGKEHWLMLRQVLSETTHPSGNLFFDIRTVALMREHGVREIYTTDTDFLQFQMIRVMNPLRTNS